MKDSKRLVAARTLAALAVLSLPAFIWIGWWQFAISIALGTASALLAPSALDNRLTASRRTRLFRLLQERLKSGGSRPR